MSTLTTISPAVRVSPPLYVPPDVFEAAQEWGANCGPARNRTAIARELGMVVKEDRKVLGVDFAVRYGTGRGPET